MFSKDTPEEIEKIYIEKLRQKTDTERALMGFSMFETARYLMNISLPCILTDKDKKIAIFNRFYGNDFSQETRDKIIEHLGMC